MIFQNLDNFFQAMEEVELGNDSDDEIPNFQQMQRDFNEYVPLLLRWYPLLLVLLFSQQLQTNVPLWNTVKFSHVSYYMLLYQSSFNSSTIYFLMRVH